MPRISVLLPCFNQGAFLDAAVDSVLAQTFQDFEIIVVDDGSDEPQTVEKLSSYSRPRTRVIRTANAGLPAARNAAARAATGEFFCALDADDRLAPEWFARAVAHLDAHQDVAFVSHWFETFGEEHWTWTPRDCDLPALLARNTINGAALVRREAFQAVGAYDASMRHGCEDWDLWLRLVGRGFHGAIIPEVLFFYRRTAGSMSRVMLDERAYRVPLEQLIDRHSGEYQSHLVDVLVRKDLESLGLFREIHALERRHLMEMAPAIARAREELAALESGMPAARRRASEHDELERLRFTAGDLQRQLGDLHASWSWRLMRPLRSLVGWWRGESR